MTPTKKLSRIQPFINKLNSLEKDPDNELKEVPEENNMSSEYSSSPL